MSTSVTTRTWGEKIILALAEFEYLTALQITRLLYAPGSLTYGKAKLKSLVDTGYALPLGGRGMSLPGIYTLTGKGRTYASAVQGVLPGTRFRPSEAQEQAANHYFMRHTLAVNDVLIAARLLSQTVPGIVLNRIYRERELRRTIYVALPEPTQRRGGTMRHICIEPDASLYFLIQETWQDFFHIEVYRTNLMERRFKQKMQGYAVYAASPQHQQLFHTPALSIAVLAATDQMARTLKRWTEEVLEQVKQPELGERFFFTSMNISETSPIEMYLSPVWQQAFGNTPTPLLVLEERQPFLADQIQTQ